VWTDTVVEGVTVAEGVTVVEPPLFDDESVATEPFARALIVEGPTTIFDRPARVARGSRKIAKLRRATSESELEDSYDAAMRQFF
jgi:hypothetical protein